jgi:hypothetical protein
MWTGKLLSRHIPDKGTFNKYADDDFNDGSQVKLALLKLAICPSF